jgi:hypothetical protein
MMFLIGGLKGVNLLKAVALKFDPPVGAPSDIAQNHLETLFPSAAAASPIAVVLKRKNGHNILGKDVQQFSLSLESWVMNYVNTTKGAAGMVIPGGVEGMYTSSINLGDKSPFIGGKNNSVSFININVLLDLTQGLSGDANVFTKALLKAYPTIVNASFVNHAVDVKMTGLLVFGIEVIKGTEHDLLMMDGIAFPMAMAVLMSILRSGRLLIIPGLSMFISIVTAYLIMWPIALHMTVISFVRCTFFNRNPHSRMALVPTPARLKRACV